MWKKHVDIKMQMDGSTKSDKQQLQQIIQEKPDKILIEEFHEFDLPQREQQQLQEGSESSGVASSSSSDPGSEEIEIPEDLAALDDSQGSDSMENQVAEFNKLELRLNSTTTDSQTQLIEEVSQLTKEHSLWTEIDKVTLEQLHYAQAGVGSTSGGGGGVWELFAKDGEMKMFKREEVIGDMVVDPLKAVHTVKGFTAHEICHYFFSPEFRTEWETTLEKMTILEKISDDSIIFHQIHKRIWPATQRDALFWSHIRQIPALSESESSDLTKAAQNSTWIVCNHSTGHSKDLYPPPANKKEKPGKFIRISLTVSLVCQTVIDPPPNGAPITRDNLTCHISYCSVVNPGGWAPASGLRAVYKREYPRFLKTFTKYVLNKCKDKPIMF